MSNLQSYCMALRVRRTGAIYEAEGVQFSASAMPRYWALSRGACVV